MSPTSKDFDPSAVFEKDSKEEELPVNVRKYACTVVSLLPRLITEDKPHLLPSTFVVPAAVYGDIAILHVEEAIHYVPSPFDERNLKQITTPNEMARSIVDDYCSAHIALADNCGPGLFWVEGRLNKNEIKKYHSRKIIEAKERQDNWFTALIMMADTDWVKNKNMQAVSDLQRLAAKCLGVHKDWVEFSVERTTTCPFCKFAIAPDSIRCMNCKEIVDQKAYDKLKGVGKE